MEMEAPSDGLLLNFSQMIKIELNSLSKRGRSINFFIDL